MTRKISTMDKLATPTKSRKREKPWYQRPEVVAERQKWYAKLAAEGFKDIEYHDRKTGDSLPVLRGFSPMDAVRYYRPDAAEFYRLAEHHILSVVKEYGEDTWQAKAWTLFSKGVGLKPIADQIKKSLVGVTKFTRLEKEKMLLSQQIDDIEAS